MERGSRSGRGRALTGLVHPSRAREQVSDMAARNSSDPQTRAASTGVERHALADGGVWARAAAQSRATPVPDAPSSVQLALDLGDEPGEGEVSGLPEMTRAERMEAELEILGLDVSSHVVDGYAEFLDVLGVTRSRDLLDRRSRAELLVAGVKVATQTPPIRSGRRVIFLTLDDATGPVDATFFEDVQGPYAATVFHTWLLLVRGELRRTGHRGVSLRATGAWDLPALHEIWQREGMSGVQRVIDTVPEGFGVGEQTESGEERRRVFVHTSGYQISPYSDIKPAGGSAPWSGPGSSRGAAGGMSRKLWHRSPGSAG
jgi:error-prone DNA polymerase